MLHHLIPPCVIALQLIFKLNYGSCSQPHKISPYEKVFQILLHEPPINRNNSKRENYEVKEKWLEQVVDHFNENNTETWMMRYLVNDEFYRPAAPIFVFVGGEWEIGQHVLQSGHFYDMAKLQEALMFYTEHRFYGQSWPKSNFSTENLKFLNVLQSLEDLKYFLTFQKASNGTLKNSKVALVGGSYSGSMVAWFMKLYPQMAHVAWASSAPLKAKMDFNEYMTLTMASIFKKGGAACGIKLKEAFKGLTKRLEKGKAYDLLQPLNMCKSFDKSNPLNRQAFFNGLGNYFASLVQSYSSLIPRFCLSFTNSDTNPTIALIKYLGDVFLSFAKLKIRDEEDYCLDFSYEGMKSIFTNLNELRTGTRPWFYQTCHEFGWFTTTISSTNELPTSFKVTSVFGGQVPLTYFRQLCQDVFGNNNNNENSSNINQLPENMGHGKEISLTLQQLHDRALAINKIFGGLSNVSEQVIFTHGLLDPWRAAGLQYSQNVILIKGYSHVEDMDSINFKDTVEMNVAKLKVAAFINKNLV